MRWRWIPIFLMAIILSSWPISLAMAATPSPGYGGDLDRIASRAFNSIRRVEGEGGNSTGLVDRMNVALEMASRGNSTGAKEILEGIISDAPMLEEEGRAASFWSSVRIYSTAAGTVIAVGVVAYLTPRIAWGMWIESKKGWVVRRKKGR